MAEFDSAIPPGGSGKLVTRVRTQGLAGSRTKTVTVTTNDPERPTVVLRVSFDARPPIGVYPRSVLNLTARGDEAISETLILRREDGEPLLVEEVATASERLLVRATPFSPGVDPGQPPAEARPAAGAAAEEPITPRQGDWLLTVSLDAAAGRVDERSRIVLKTDHPRQPELIIPVRITVQMPLLVQPGILRIKTVTADPVSRQIRLEHRGHQPFRIIDLEVEGDLPGVTVTGLLADARPVHEIDVHLDPGRAAGGAHEGQIVASTDLRRVPIVRIPVSVVVEGPAAASSAPLEPTVAGSATP